MTRKTKTASQEAQTQSPQPAAKISKLDQIIALLRRPQGATIEAMMLATGWQAHSVRGALAGSLKKKAGLTIVSDKVDGLRTYRIAPDTGA